MNNISVEPINNNVVVEVSAPKDSVSVSFYPTENPQIYSELAKKYCDDAAYFSNNAVVIIKDTVDNIENGLVNSINAVADDLTNIDAVNSNKTNIDLIAGNLVNINAVAADLTNINYASVSATSALISAGLAQDWANKTNGKVDGSEYSAKYYAEQAAQSASQAAAEQVNSDWNENDNTKKSYILNKPTIPSIDNLANKDLSNLSTIGGTKILPSQTGQSGKYLTTDGSSASWARVDALPPQSTATATQYLMSNGATAEWASVAFRNIGEIVASTIPLTDAGLHLLEGSLIQGGGIYNDFVEYIANLYGDGTNIPDYFCTESEWQQSVTDYGVCGKFVYDSVNNTVRLPKFYSAERYLIASSSSGTEWYRVYSDGWCEQGGYKGSTSTNSTINLLKNYIDTNYSITTVVYGGYTFNASSCNNKTTSSFTTFQDVPVLWEANGYTDTSSYQNTKKYEYIVIATTTKTDIQVDIDEIATDLNGKADVDLSNINPSQSAKETIISWGMPDYSAGVSITSYTSSSNQFIAPCDGIINWGHSTANGHRAYLNSLPLTTYGSTTGAYYYTNLFVPISKNETWYATGYTDASFELNNKFFPLKGAS